MVKKLFKSIFYPDRYFFITYWAKNSEKRAVNGYAFMTVADGGYVNINAIKDKGEKTSIIPYMIKELNKKDYEKLMNSYKKDRHAEG